jgi:hypothetical protein
VQDSEALKASEDCYRAVVENIAEEWAFSQSKSWCGYCRPPPLRATSPAWNRKISHNPLQKISFLLYLQNIGKVTLLLQDQVFEFSLIDWAHNLSTSGRPIDSGWNLPRLAD